MLDVLLGKCVWGKWGRELTSKCLPVPCLHSLNLSLSLILLVFGFFLFLKRKESRNESEPRSRNALPLGRTGSQINSEWMMVAFYSSTFLNIIHLSGALTELFCCYKSGAKGNCCRLGARSVHPLQPCISSQCRHFTERHWNVGCIFV